MTTAEAQQSLTVDDVFAKAFGKDSLSAALGEDLIPLFHARFGLQSLKRWKGIIWIDASGHDFWPSIKRATPLYRALERETRHITQTTIVFQNDRVAVWYIPTQSKGGSVLPAALHIQEK